MVLYNNYLIMSPESSQSSPERVDATPKKSILLKYRMLLSTILLGLVMAIQPESDNSDLISINNPTTEDSSGEKKGEFLEKPSEKVDFSFEIESSKDKDEECAGVVLFDYINEVIHEVASNTPHCALTLYTHMSSVKEMQEGMKNVECVKKYLGILGYAIARGSQEGRSKRKKKKKNAYKLFDIIPKDLQNILKRYNPKIFTKLKGVRVFKMSSKCSTNPAGIFYDKSLSKSGHVEYLIALNENDVSNTDVLPLIVHEIYGHGENPRQKMDRKYFSQNPNNALNKPKNYCDMKKRKLLSEFRSFYLMYHFMEWCKNNKVSFSAKYNEKYSYLYKLFKKAKKTRNWIAFKRFITARYISSDDFLCRLVKNPDKLKYLESFKDEYGGEEQKEFLLFFDDILTPDHPLSVQKATN